MFLSVAVDRNQTEGRVDPIRSWGYLPQKLVVSPGGNMTCSPEPARTPLYPPYTTSGICSKGTSG